MLFNWSKGGQNNKDYKFVWNIVCAKEQSEEIFLDINFSAKQHDVENIFVFDIIQKKNMFFFCMQL